MRKKILAMLCATVLCLALVAMAMDDEPFSVSADSDGYAVTFAARQTWTFIKNDSTSISVYVKWYKAGEAVPATDTGGFELKPGESFERSSALGGLEFVGMTVRSASSTAAVRILAGKS